MHFFIAVAESLAMCRRFIHLSLSKSLSVPSTEMCKFMGKELRENAPAARQSEEAGFTQFLTLKSTLLSLPLLCFKSGVFPSMPMVAMGRAK